MSRRDVTKGLLGLGEMNISMDIAWPDLLWNSIQSRAGVALSEYLGGPLLGLRARGGEKIGQFSLSTTPSD